MGGWCDFFSAIRMRVVYCRLATINVTFYCWTTYNLSDDHADEPNYHFSMSETRLVCFFFKFSVIILISLVCGSTFKVLNGKQPVCAVGLSHFQNKRHSYEPKQNFLCSFNKLATKSIVLISIHNILFFSLQSAYMKIAKFGRK